MEWTEASIYTSTEGVELLCGKLLELGINGFAVEDAQDFEAFLEETTPHWDDVDDSLMASIYASRLSCQKTRHGVEWTTAGGP